MFDPQVVDYIKKAIVAGQTIDQIKSALLANGWSEMEINENILEANAKKEAPPSAAPTTKISDEPIVQEVIQSTEPKIEPKPEIKPAEMKPELKVEPVYEPKLQPRAEEKPISRFDPNYKAEETPSYSRPTATTPSYEAPKEAITPDTSTVQRAYTYQKEAKQEKQAPRQGRLVGLLISLAVIILIFALGGAAFYFFKPLDYIKNLISPVIVEVNNITGKNGETTPSFVNYNLESTTFNASLPDYTIALADISNLSNFEKKQGVSFTANQKSALTTNNFFVASNFDKFYSTNADDYASRNDDWTGLYKTIGGSARVDQRQPENSLFISSDFLTHIYHKLLEQQFSYIEELNLYPALTQLSNSLLKSSATGSYTSTQQEASYNRLSAYFLVSSAILNNASTDYQAFKQNNYIDDTKTDTKANVLKLVDSLATENKVSDTAKDIAKQEINLIFDAAKFSVSPLMGAYQPNTQEDYTQYSPRSHYSKNVVLRDYFRAMMWFGRMNFLLNSTELTRDSANIVSLLTDDQLKQWESVYQPTTFLVGQSDDLTIYDFKKAIKAVNFTASNQTDEEITKLQNELKTYQNPKIMSSVIQITTDGVTKEDLQNSTKGFRFMGQRFTPDAFVFSSLTQGDEKADETTGQKLPSTPTALMVSTLMGDIVSKDLLNTWITTNAPNSDKVLANKIDSLQTYFNQTTQTQWTQNIYWSWLYTIKSLFKTTNATGYPMFMRNTDWSKKQTQSFLGSWTELKHDTLLYAKQSYAELGGGGDEGEAQPIAKGYVEPNIEFFDRLIALVNMTNDGLTKYNLIPEAFQSRNATFVETLKFYRKLAVSELQNETITDDDFEKLRLSAYALDQILQAPDSQVQLESNARSALIADVHTDTVKNQILYEADGIPNYIYVAVKDANGTRLTKGLVYSYYEFTNPVGKRLDDQTWQKWNYSSTIKLLKLPDWSKALIK